MRFLTCGVRGVFAGCVLLGAGTVAVAGCSGDDNSPPTATGDGGQDGTAPVDGSTSDAALDGSVDSSTDAGAGDAGDGGLADASGDAGDGGGTDASGDAGEGGVAEAGTDAGDGGAQLSSLKHLVIIYLENHSFDNLFGSWPGADGLADGGAAIAQVGPDGGAYTTLPEYTADPSNIESLDSISLANAPFDLTKYFQEGALTPDLLHRFYQEQLQINGGKMDSYVLWNDESPGQSMGYWPTSSLPLPQWMQTHASNVTLLDHFFHAAFGGSFLNHFWLVAAQTPTFPNAPAESVTTLGDAGELVASLDTTSDPPNSVYAATSDKQVTPDGFAVNTSYSVNQPHPSTYDIDGGKPEELVPQQTFPTIADELDGAGVTWAWYAGGWNVALANAGIASVGTDAGSQAILGGPSEVLNIFEYHHQPFVFFKNWGGTSVADGGAAEPGTVPNGKWALNHNLQDQEDFIAAARAGTLPAVSFVKPLFDEHPNYTTETDSETDTVSLINDVVTGPEWSESAIIITYDENGGSWDHVPPPTAAPKADKWGPGTRVPGIVISPFAKGGVDSTEYDTTAILKLIEKRWNLTALSARDGAQADLSANALKFTSP
jgi:acid phosphatase